MDKKRIKKYEELTNRLVREKSLVKAANAMTLKKNLLSNGGVTKKTKANGETTYVWKKVRKA